MNGILIPLFQPFVIGSDRSESDCLGRKSALPHSPAIAQFPLSLVKSFLLLYKNYYFLFYGARLYFSYITNSIPMLQRFFLYQVQGQYQINTLFYKVLCQLLTRSCHKISTFETQRLEIFWKIILDQSVVIHNNNLDCKFLMYFVLPKLSFFC